MEPGLRLLIQLVLEFAPLMTNLITEGGRYAIQKQSSTKLTANNSAFSQVIAEFLQTTNGEIVNEGIMTDLIQPKYLQQQVAIYNNATKLKICREEQETARKLPEIQKILDNWPLKLSPGQILDSSHRYGYIPLKIFFAPPQVKLEEFAQKPETITQEIELKLAEGLREFINSHYSLHNPERPTEFLAGAWNNNSFHSESSIKALFNSLKTQPTLVLKSENDGDYFNFHIGYWGWGQADYCYKTISRFSYREILQDSAKKRALAWKKVRDQLLALGEDLSTINQLGGENTTNLEIWEKLEKLQEQGIDISQLSLKYQVNQQDFAQLCQLLINCHCLVVAWIADAYHLFHHNMQPLLPKLLPGLLKEALDLDSLTAYATSYKQVYQALKNERGFWLPELALQLAQGLSPVSHAAWSEAEVNYAINTWLQFRQVSPAAVSHPLVAMQLVAKVEDEAFVIRLKEYFTAIGDSQSIADVERVLAKLELLKNQRNFSSVNVLSTLTQNFGQVSAIAISPDGEILVSGCSDKTVKVWHVQHGSLIRTLNGNLGAIASLAISPDGSFLAVGSCEHPQGNVKLWNLTSGKLCHTFSGHQNPVNVVVISPDGQILASGSNKIKIWHLQKGDRICTLWHSSTVNAIAISADGNILASGSSDHKVRLWNPRNGDPLRTIAGHSQEVTSVAIHPEGKILVSGSADTKIKIWDLSTGKLLNTLIGHLGKINSLIISPDGQFLWTASDDTTIKLWSISTGEILHTLGGHNGAVNSLALSLDGKLLASGSSDQTIKVWQIIK